MINPHRHYEEFLRSLRHQEEKLRHDATILLARADEIHLQAIHIDIAIDKSKDDEKKVASKA